MQMKEGDVRHELYSVSCFSALPLPFYYLFCMTLPYLFLFPKHNLSTSDDSSQSGSQYSLEVHLQQGNQCSWPHFSHTDSFSYPFPSAQWPRTSIALPAKLLSGTVVDVLKQRPLHFVPWQCVSGFPVADACVPSCLILLKGSKIPQIFLLFPCWKWSQQPQGCDAIAGLREGGPRYCEWEGRCLSQSLYWCMLSVQQEILRASALGNRIPPLLVPVISATTLGTGSSCADDRLLDAVPERLWHAKSVGDGFLVGWVRKATAVMESNS